MKILFSFLCIVCFGLVAANAADNDHLPTLDLSQEVLTTSLIAANLSAIAYDDPTLWASNDTSSGFFHPEFDSIKFYTDEPDQAILATKNGLCFLAFRGTNANFDDWSQNAGLGNIDVCRDNDPDAATAGECCEARGGFADFLTTEPAAEGLMDLETCIANCVTPEDCLVITGHSQGGAASAIAAVTLYRHNPTVITFGQPPTMDEGCPYIYSEKYYRYVNSVEYENDMGFDLVVFAPNWVSRSKHYGYFIMLSEDPTAVAYLGFDANYTFAPNTLDNDANAHSISGESYSYETRVANLLSNHPVTTDGFEEGNICKAEYAEICESGLCVEFQCLPVGGVTELCVYDSCEQDEDCAGTNVCIYDSCAVGPGLVEDGCSCFNDNDCLSGDCITVDALAADFRCGGTPNVTEFCVFGSCDKDEDCFGDDTVCIYGACAAGHGLVEEGCSCQKDEDCISNSCITINSFTFDYRCDRCVTCDLPELNLTKEVLTTSLIAANLSSIAYDDPTIWVNTNTSTGYEHPDFDSIKFYEDEPDQAILATKNGLCFLAFRGTNANFEDWSQNAGLGNFNVFRDNDMNATEDFCEARGGFADFLSTEPAAEGLMDLEACLASCELDDCLVITGHSQGGAASAIAAITLFRHSPTVITFGQPPTLDAGCPYIISDKYYRYVNSMQDIAGDKDMGFDLVVFAPNWVSRSEHYGYYIMLGEDPAAVAYLGYDANYTFVPSLADQDPNAHSISGEAYSYETRIANLLSSFPNVTTDGFEEGSVCEEPYAELCESGLCVEFECLPVGGVQELCVYDSCEKDEDCAGDNVCIYDACAAGPGLVEDGCSCFRNEDCLSGDCQTVNLVRADFRCGGSAKGGESGAATIGQLWSLFLFVSAFAGGLFFLLLN